MSEVSDRGSRSSLVEQAKIERWSSSIARRPKYARLDSNLTVAVESCGFRSAKLQATTVKRYWFWN